MPEPQPAAVVITASTSSGNAVRFVRARSRRDALFADVHGERAAAGLILRDDDFDTGAAEHADRRPADLRREHLLRAAGEQRDAGAALPHGGLQRGQRTRGRQIGRDEIEHRVKRLRHERLHAARELAGGRGKAEASRIRQRGEHGAAAEPIHERPLPFGLGLHAERREQIAVGDARRTCGDARQAAEAAIDVRQRLLQRQLALEHVLHQEDASARRIHLLAEHAIGGTRGQTESAMHARRHGPRHVRAVRSQMIPRQCDAASYYVRGHVWKPRPAPIGEQFQTSSRRTRRADRTPRGDARQTRCRTARQSAATPPRARPRPHRASAPGRTARTSFNSRSSASIAPGQPIHATSPPAL